ncbi:putative Heat shock 70 kDa protein [Glarea lozoyensis 74030]|uniref:Putative Heat shock 70 kDa protein n=1 Tax=Glarea lozoyensis (strain ATCC 74030 / MF5533) TaxID=1104152 RepID=H0EDR5_GLAL7|nr:putative Heat shock 70 kDa protein [Glarea lozoyensis 74030]
MVTDPKDATVLHPVDEDFHHVIGIHLGQSYSQVGVFRNETFEVITDDKGRSNLPCYVAFLDVDAPLVGFDAKEQASSNPQITVYDARRLFGRNFLDPEVQQAVKELPYAIVNQGGEPLIMIHTSHGNVIKTPHEISGLIVAKLKDMAERYLNETVKDAVITVPSNFNDAKRQETKEAAELAGLNVLRILDETTSTGIAYEVDTKGCLRTKWRYDCTYLVYNIGDKHSEISLLHIEKGVFEIWGTVSDQNFGWSDLEIIPTVLDQVVLYMASMQPSQKVSKLVERVLKEAKIQKGDVDGIIVVSEDSHVAKTQEVLEAYFEGKETLAPSGFRYDQSIVRGAAMQGYLITGQEGCTLSFPDSLLALGLEISTGTFMPVIRQGTVIPLRNKIRVSTATDNQGEVVLRIFEGQREVAAKNRLLGTIKLVGLPRQVNGPEIEISFEVDADELLTVSAVVGEGLASGELTVQLGRWRYTDEQLDEILRDAERYREEDLQSLAKFPLLIEDSVMVRDGGD